MSTPSRSTALTPRERAIADAAGRGVRAALVRHKQAGVPVAVWQDGRVALIPAEEALAAMDAADASDRAKSSQTQADRSTEAA